MSNSHEFPSPVPATEVDIASIRALEVSCFGAEAWSSEQIAAEFARTEGIRRVLICPVRQSIVGMTLGWVIPNEAELIRVAVAPSHRRNGLGTVLLRDFVEQSERAGADHCFLEVRADNIAAIRLYGSLDFHRQAIRREYYRDGCDAWMMRRITRKRLGPST